MAEKSKSKKPRPVSPVTLDKIILLMIGGLTRQGVIDACRKELDISAARAREAMAEGRRRITLAADYNRDEVLGEAVRRLDNLYQRAMDVKEFKTALAAQKEKARLLLQTIIPGQELTDVGHHEIAEAPEDRREIEDDELASIVNAIESALEPLGLTAADDVNDTDTELIAMAGEEIVRLRRALKRATAKKRTQHPTANKKRPTPK